MIDKMELIIEIMQNDLNVDCQSDFLRFWACETRFFGTTCTFVALYRLFSPKKCSGIFAFLPNCSQKKVGTRFLLFQLKIMLTGQLSEAFKDGSQIFGGTICQGY